ncbi:MAG: hemin-degrading factor, partial [Pseudomonadales bacterium]
QNYQDKKANTPMLFPTEGAKALGVSEFELLLSLPYSRYMGQDFQEVLESLAQFSKLESITRNDYAVSEKTGKYENLKVHGRMGILLNVGGLDLRYFMSKWKHMLAVDDTSKPNRPIHSIQFFDEQGNAVNKIYLKSLDELSDWQALITQTINKFADKAESATIELAELEQHQDWQFKQLSDDDKQTLQDKWGMAKQLTVNAIEPMLNLVKDKQLSLMTFVGNTGLVQIQTGTLNTIKRMGYWINILDKDHNDFTLHLKDGAVAQLWCVKRPTKDGLVTCVEAFDDKGRTIVTFFGQRQEGEPENANWVEITDSLMMEFVMV